MIFFLEWWWDSTSKKLDFWTQSWLFWLCRFANVLMSSNFVYGLIFVKLRIFLWSQWKYCVCLSVSICLPLLVWPFTFTEKSDFDITITLKIEIVLCVTRVITIKVKLLQMILGYVTSFVVCQSICLYFCIFERFTLHIIMVS